MADDNPATTPERGTRRWNTGSLWVGITFILIGFFFVLRTAGIVTLHNWWALFILIPAAGSFSSAVSTYRLKKKFTRSVAGSIGGGVIILAVALIFLFRLDWVRVWPVFIILVGLSILLGAFGRRD